MEKERSNARISKEAIRHAIINSLSEHEWLIESKLYNVINEQLRDIKYRNSDIVIQLRGFILNNVIYKTVIVNGNEQDYYYIKVSDSSRGRLRKIGDYYFKQMRMVMLEEINVPLPKNS